MVLAAVVSCTVVLALLASSVVEFVLLQQSVIREQAIAAAAYRQHDRLLQLVNEETGVRGYVASGDAQFLDVYRTSLHAVRSQQLDSANRRNVAAVQAYFANVIRLVRDGRRDDALAELAPGKSLFDRLRATDNKTEATYRKRLAEQRRRTLELTRLGVTASLGTAAVLVLLVCAGWLLARTAAFYRRSALRDPLTGAGNRRAAVSTLSRLLKARQQRSFGVLYLDLDGFKRVNDRHGHAAGDAILRGAAARLREELRDEDLVFRMGGDEFLCIITPPVSRSSIASIAERLHFAVSRPYEAKGDTFVVGASIGWSAYPHDGRKIGELLSGADKAMYTVKRGGGGVAASRRPIPIFPAPANL